MLFIYAAICLTGMCLPAIYILARRGPDKSPWLLALFSVHGVTALIVLPAAVYLHMITTFVPWLVMTLPGSMVAIIYHDAGVNEMDNTPVDREISDHYIHAGSLNEKTAPAGAVFISE